MILLIVMILLLDSYDKVCVTLQRYSSALAELFVRAGTVRHGGKLVLK